MSRNNELKVSGCQGNSKQGIRLSGYQNWNSRRFFFFLPSYRLGGIIPLGDPLRDTSNNKADFNLWRSRNRCINYFGKMKEGIEYIGRKEYPTDHASRSYREGFFLEAIQVLHGFLEVKMRDLLMVSRHGNIRRSLQEIWDITGEMGFNVLARALFISGKLTKKEYNDIQRFNSLRNRLVHKFFWEPYGKCYKGVPKKEYDFVFNEGIRLVDQIDFKSGSILYRRKSRRRSQHSRNKTV